MHRNYLESSYNDVSALINDFTEFSPGIGKSLMKGLNEVHDIPEIGEAIFEEERYDVNRIITILKSKTTLNDGEREILNEALIILNDIECKIAYGSGIDRTNAKHTINYNFEHLRDLSNEETYLKCLSFAEINVKELFKHKLGTRPGTVIFNNALDVLFSFYNYSILLDEFTPQDKQIVVVLIYDIAKNINKPACKYLESKSEVFANLSDK